MDDLRQYLHTCDVLDDQACILVNSQRNILVKRYVFRITAETRVIVANLTNSNTLSTYSGPENLGNQYRFVDPTISTSVVEQSLKSLLLQATHLFQLCCRNPVELMHAFEPEPSMSQLENAVTDLFLLLSSLRKGRRRFAEFRTLMKMLVQVHDASVEVFSGYFMSDVPNPSNWLDQQSFPNNADLDCLRLKFDSVGKILLKEFAQNHINTRSNGLYSQYNIGERAEGSLSIVSKLTHITTGKCFAQKEFKKVQLECQRREVGVLALCDHRNLIQLEEAFFVKERPVELRIWMTPWAPYTLWDFLYDSDVIRKKTCPWFKPDHPESDAHIYGGMNGLTDGARWLHTSFIKHKDIKPSNILLHHPHSSGFVPIITDLGLSKIYSPDGSTNFTDSTYTYLAPEQHEKRSSSLCADVWQLGCTFALIIALARGGKLASEKMYRSYNRTDEKCVCSIGHELESFVKALEDICLPGNPSQTYVYYVTRSMIEKFPEKRANMETVKRAMKALE